MPVIRIDDDVYRAIQLRAVPLEDTVNSAMRKILGLDNLPTSRKVRPAENSQLTAQREFYLPVLGVLRTLGGKARLADIYRLVGAELEDRLKPGDYAKVSGGELRWRNALRFVRLQLQRQGLLKSTSPRGYWELTEQGRMYVEGASK